MLLDSIVKFLGSQLFANILLFITIVVAFSVGYKQIILNDVVEIYATPATKQIINSANNSSTLVPIINIQNTGTRLVYMDKYIFNGSEYVTHGQVLPPTYSQSNALYWINLPSTSSGINHVSLVVHYHDLDKRRWKSEIVADFIDNSWKISSLPRVSE